MDWEIVDSRIVLITSHCLLPEHFPLEVRGGQTTTILPGLSGHLMPFPIGARVCLGVIEHPLDASPSEGSAVRFEGRHSLIATPAQPPVLRG